MSVRQNSPRGVTLIETQVAAAMLIAGLTAIFASLATFAALTTNTERISVARSIANELLEDFAIDSTLDPRLMVASGSYRSDPFGRELPDVQGGPLGADQYDVSWTVAPGPVEDIPELKRVDLTIKWRSTLRKHQLKFFTYAKSGS